MTATIRQYVRTEHYPAVSGDVLALNANAAAKRTARRRAAVHGRFDTAPTTGRIHPTDGDYLTKYRRYLDPTNTTGTLWERIAEGGQR